AIEAPFLLALANLSYSATIAPWSVSPSALGVGSRASFAINDLGKRKVSLPEDLSPKARQPGTGPRKRDVSTRAPATARNNAGVEKSSIKLGCSLGTLALRLIEEVMI